MKVEYTARELTCLCAKTYYADPAPEQDGAKKGMKGIQESNIVKMAIIEVAQEGDTSHTVINRGFRKPVGAKNAGMGLQMYSQDKKGICAGDTKGTLSKISRIQCP